MDAMRNKVIRGGNSESAAPEPGLQQCKLAHVPLLVYKRIISSRHFNLKNSNAHLRLNIWWIFIML